MEIRVREGFPGQRLCVMPPAVLERCRALPVVRDLFVTDIGHYPPAAHHYVARPAGSPGAIAIYCTSGRGWCETASGRWALREGSALFIPPGEAHRYGADEEAPWSICWVHFSGTRSADYLAALGLSPEAPLLHVPDAGLVGGAFEEMYAALDFGYPDDSLLGLSTLLGRWLGLLKRHSRAAQEPARRNEDLILRSIRHMREHLHEPLRLADLAGDAGLSPSHYSWLFRRQVNASPGVYFIRMKMQKACELLDGTRLSVREAAECVGYTDPYHFSRTFKRVQGVSPTAYRQAVKG